VIRRLRLELEGVVQGVGFRPFVHRLAASRHLAGWITNSSRGVTIELQGSAAVLEDFLLALESQRPPHSRIDRLERRLLEPETIAPGKAADAPPAPLFTILPSAPTSAPTALSAPVPADLAPCAACRAEWRDPRNRRHRYAFNSCAHCGPRYSVLRSLPFERAHTTLASFPLCAACLGEFNDPADRRFHAQTIGCPACGPQLSWWVSGQNPAAQGDAALVAAAAALRNGQIVALKGVGGFQLLVLASAAAAVAELRRRKGRPEQAFAVLAPHLAWVRRQCRVSTAEARLLVGPSAPIVLLRRRDAHHAAPLAATLAAGVAPHNPWLGVMLPASPLHAQLVAAVGEPLVATSGNHSGEPLRFEDADGLQLLAGLADGLLSHDRPIANPVDDGVAQVVGGAVMLLRQARGVAPTAVDLPDWLPAASQAQPGLLVAMGGQQKAAVAIGQGRRALLGPHLGDLGMLAGEQRLRGSLIGWLERQGLSPARIAVDLHPGYASHRIGQELARSWGGLPLLAVQHHHAHLLACLAEHGLGLPATGVAWDGAGHGPDGLLWGGECLRLEPAAGGALTFTHLARLRPFPLPGGERALREPRRAALGLLFAAFGADCHAHTAVATRAAFDAEEQRVLVRLLEQRLNAPLCTSIGRLFDALASLLGLIQRCSFEGQAALRLQAVAQEALEAPARQPWQPYRIPIRIQAPPWLLDWQPLLVAVLADLDLGRPAASIALGFHQALAALLVELAQRLQLNRILLSGGCFQNSLLLELAVAGLAQAGIDAVWPQRVPCNDGGLALGQLLALASSCDEAAQQSGQAPILAL